MSNQSCSGSTIIANIHYKNNAFVMMQHVRGILTMENVTYSDFMKMMENDNVLRMLTRDTIVHTPNSAISTFHYLVSMPSLFLNNMPESFTKQWIQYSTMFDACKNKLLVHWWCMFLIFESFHINPQTLKQYLKPSPEPHFHFAHAMAAFKMLLWPMTFCETLTAALGFYCDCL